MKLCPQTPVPSTSQTPDQAAPLPKPVLQLTAHREADGDALGAQGILSLAAKFPFIFHPYVNQLQDPRRRGLGGAQGFALPGPAQHGRGIAVSNADQAQELTLQDRQRHAVAQHLRDWVRESPPAGGAERGISSSLFPQSQSGQLWRRCARN